MVDDLTLAELLAAKFSHDITGPIGAINNGMEFLTEESFDMKDQALSLVTSSAAEAAARLQFFRQAYGSVSITGEANLNALKALTEKFLSWGKTNLDWPDQYTDASNISINQRMGKLILNLILITTNTLLHGGTTSIRLHRLNSAEDRIAVKSTGKTVKLSEEAENILNGKFENVTFTPRNIQFYLTYRLTQQLHTKLTVEHTNTSIEIITIHRKS